MRKRLHTRSAAQSCESPRIGDNVVRRFRLTRRVLTIFLLLIAGAVMLWPATSSQSLGGNLLTAKAQGNNSSSQTTTAPTQRVTKGATITGNRITLKPGYKFTRVSAKKVAVRKKNGGGTIIVATCKCLKSGQGGSTACSVALEGASLACISTSCAQCYWGAPTKSR